MIRRSVREWDHLHIGQGADTISRLEANRLLAVARRAQRALRVGGEASESILIDFGNKLTTVRLSIEQIQLVIWRRIVVVVVNVLKGAKKLDFLERVDG